jgi:acyl-coenzyme A thioesterase PaaI-like protein
VEPLDLADGDGREPRVAAAPWCKSVGGGHPDARLTSRPGTEQLKAMDHGTALAVDRHALVEFGPGSAMFATPLGGWLTGPAGTVSLGPLTIPADMGIACAVITGLPEGLGLTTSEMGLRQVRPVRPGRRGRGAWMLEAGPPVAVAEVTLTVGDGTLIAHRGALCVTLPTLTAPPRPGAVRDTPDPGPSDQPALWQRPLPADAGRSASSPLSRLTGLWRLAVVATGSAVAGGPA